VSVEPCLFAGRWPLGGKTHRLWWNYSDHWCGDYLIVWRPLCWFVRRKHEEHYGSCVTCGKSMHAKARSTSGDPS
jgi:hypothetical protein